nr:nucleotidyltransferase domain-containing protein [Candidatus Njordarchaeota archaeon]
MKVLRRLSIGEATFKELNMTVPNTKTLTRRLSELAEERLLQKTQAHYKITDEGFATVIKVAELEEEVRHKWVNEEEFFRIKYEWMRISLSLLTRLLLREFGDELISIILYGSAVKETFQLDRSDIDLLYILEDDTKNVWQHEINVFRSFQSAWEYRAPDYWLRTKGFYGYPEVTTACLEKRNARNFQPTYLDMLHHRAIVYDKEGFFQVLIRRLEKALKTLGAIRRENPDGTYSWILKPDIIPGEVLEIDLG